jgi:hypothetical protein
MKFLVNIVLFIFITFLSTPTLVGMIDEKVDTSYFYSMCEEEENHAPFNEIKSIPSNHYSLLNIDLEESKAFDISTKHDVAFFNLAHQIFSPPPNLI